MKTVSQLLTIILKVMRIFRYLNRRHIVVLALMLSVQSYAQRAVFITTSTEPFPIAPGEWVQSRSDDDFTYIQSLTASADAEDIVMYADGFTSTRPIVGSLSRYLFDGDDELEYLVYRDDASPLLQVMESDGTVSAQFTGAFRGIVMNGSGAFLITGDQEYPLPGVIPGNVLPVSGRPGEGRIDTVVQVVTERIYTSDTVYLSETIVVDSETDTLVVERRTSQVDTVHHFTTQTITRVDSVYLVGGDYAIDSKVITSTDEEVSRTLDAYPNPASDRVTIATYGQHAGELRLYDTMGNVVRNIALSSGFHDTVIDLNGLDGGMYLYMLVSDNERSKTRKLIIQ